MTTATVSLWGTTVGYIALGANETFARFEYDPEFVNRGIELAPLVMPLKARHIYQFTELAPHTFHGVPGLIADSLPDKYGNQLINVWLARTGRTADSFNAVDRLCYTGSRGMGALEFEPAHSEMTPDDRPLNIQELTELASMAFASKESLQTQLTDDRGDEGLLDILSVGTSAGGARAKAVIAFNPETREVRSGQLNLPEGYEHWLIKFDGVELSGDWGIADPAGYGLLEYTYYLVAQQCDIVMKECRLFSENGRHHFMTKRFDRDIAGKKHFMQTFGALNHFDYYNSGQYSYEQLFMTMKQLGISKKSMEQQFRRAVFNVVGCNQDDHVKNFSFTMDRRGQWGITPAYDLCHSHGSAFTRFHQLSLNGKTTDFTLNDLKSLAEYAGLKQGSDRRILEQTIDAFSQWHTLAETYHVPKPIVDHVQKTLRLVW